METLKYEYKIKWWPAPLALLFFGFAAIHSLEMAQHSEKEIVFLSLIHLAPPYSNWFHGLLFCFALIIALLALFISFLALSSEKKEIILYSDRLLAPKNMITNRLSEIFYSDIDHVDLLGIQSEQQILIKHKDGQLVISESLLADKQNFLAILLNIQKRSKRTENLVRNVHHANIKVLIDSQPWWQMVTGRLETQVMAMAAFWYPVFAFAGAGLTKVIGLPSFTLLFCNFMPMFMLAFFIKLGVWRRDYVSSKFNWVILTIIISMPIWITFYIMIKSL